MYTINEYSPAAVIIYETLLTWEDEWEMIWSRKLNASSWIFLVNRIAGIIYALALLLRYSGTLVS